MLAVPRIGRGLTFAVKRGLCPFSGYAAMEKDSTTVFRALLLGDIVGRPGRQALAERLPGLRERLALDLVIANGENAAGGIGLTPPTYREIRASGVDIVTSGNHIWRYADLYPSLNKEANLLRPANMPPGTPGRGHTTLTLPCGVRIAVINLQGRTFMAAVDCPFRAVEAILERLPEDIDFCFVDFHAEATSEKRAMAFFLDSKVSCLVGTHTHVQTADACILPNGTAYISDLGMCGAERSSVLGMEPEPVLRRFLHQLPSRFTPAAGPAGLNGLLVDLDRRTGLALRASILREPRGYSAKDD